MINFLLITVLLRLLWHNQWPGELSSANTEEAISVPKTRTVYNSNSWMSSLYSFPSQPVFALPASYKFTEAGVEIGSKEPVVSEKSIVTGHDPICKLRPNGGIRQAKVKEYGDWNVVIEIKDTSDSVWNVYLAQGSPALYIVGQGELNIDCVTADKTKIFNGFIYKTNQRQLVVQSKKNTHRVITLPTEINSLEEIVNSPWNYITNTTLSWTRKDSDWHTTYAWESKTGDSVLTTLWPHLSQSVSELPSNNLGIYRTHLGDLKLHNLSKLTTITPIMELPESFEEIANPEYRKDVVKALEEDVTKVLSETTPEGVYFRGVWLGKVTTLVQLADAYELNELKKDLISRLEKELEVSMNNFYYDAEKKMYSYSKPEFGHEEGNDHHFHYGYYLRAMAVLLEEKPALKSKFMAIGNEMVRDIANPIRENDKYPFLRSYSPYEGHSWADGDANFGDGNNQESTSEAMNAWYAVYLWGKKTEQSDVTNLGSWLFSQELQGTKAYWFGENNPYPQEYQHALSAIVWGGKRDFTTWFSGELMHIYGIELLPITPASVYLKDMSNSQLHLAEMSEELKKITSHEWEDLYLVYLSYHRPDEALQKLQSITNFKGTHLKSLTYHVVYKNAE